MDKKEQRIVIREKPVFSIVIGILAAAMIIFVIPAMIINPIINNVKESALFSFNQQGTAYAKTGHITYNLFFNEIIIRQAEFHQAHTVDFDSFRIKAAYIKGENPNWLNYIFGGSISFGKVTVDGLSVNLYAGESGGNRAKTENVTIRKASLEMEKNNPISGMLSSLPEKLKGFRTDEFDMNSAKIMYKLDSARTDSISGLNLNIGDIDLSRKEPLFSYVKFTARDLCKNFQRGNKAEARFIKFDSRESILYIDSLRYNTSWSKERYFASLKQRQDMLNFTFPSMQIKFRRIRIGEIPYFVVEKFYMPQPVIRITTPKYIPLPENPPKEAMPNELLNGAPFGIKLDSLKAYQGKIILDEIYKEGGKTAELLFDNVTIDAADIANNRFKNTPPARLKAKAYLQGKGEMDLNLEIPLSSNRFSYKASGRLKAMDLRELNGYLQYSEYIKITSGKVENIEYSLELDSGVVDVTAIPAYSNIKIEVLDEVTERESGADEKFLGFIANEMAIRKSNPDDKGTLKKGEVVKATEFDETFFERLWLPLKRGLAVVVGFSE